MWKQERLKKFNRYGGVRMYVHIGDNVLVRASDIITILDKQTIKASAISNEFLATQTSARSNETNTSYKSIVVTKDDVYYSPIASTTLKKRSIQLQNQE